MEKEKECLSRLKLVFLLLIFCLCEGSGRTVARRNRSLGPSPPLSGRLRRRRRHAFLPTLPQHRPTNDGRTTDGSSARAA